MICRYRKLGLALLAIFALSALVAQSAAAVPLTVTNGASGTTFYTGDQDGGSIKYSNSSGTFTCTSRSFTGTSTGSSVNELTLTASSSGCVAFGFVTSHTVQNGCTYTFTTPTLLSANEVTWGKEQIHLVYPEGKRVEITPTSFGVSVCTQFIGPQTPGSGHVIGRNSGKAGEEMDITLDLAIEGISYTGSGGACGTSGTAAIAGNSTLQAFSNSTHTIRRGITFN